LVRLAYGERHRGTNYALQNQAICDRFHAMKYRGQCDVLVAAALLPWTKPLSHAVAMLESSWKVCLSVGDYQWAGYQRLWAIHTPLLQGKKHIHLTRTQLHYDVSFFVTYHGVMRYLCLYG
jgi:hypothetical protein